ncbi:30S ribosomal protein S3ae [Candidatus Bathyarchaeota archaeon]|nr:MAG: 30S ribosomal protein S3ae [Candidatus Bathyarchaeota archaeon]
MSSRRKGRKVVDKWKLKKWYMVLAPPYFGEQELFEVPADSPEKLLKRVLEATLYDITHEDIRQQVIKLYFQVVAVEGDKAKTIFKGHEYSRDFLRSLVRRRTSKVDGIFDVTTKDGYKLRVYPCALTQYRIKTSQQRAIRKIMKEIVERKARELNFGQFVQEMVLGKMASDIYNEAKKVAPLRHVGIRKSKLLYAPELERLESSIEHAIRSGPEEAGEEGKAEGGAEAREAVEARAEEAA